MADALVREAQQWVNATYVGVPGYVPADEDGFTGWRTMFALTRALQHELGISALSDTFGPTTQSRFTSVVGAVTPATTQKNVVRILQCALWCKGYSGGDIESGAFNDTVVTSCVRVKRDMGLAATAPDIDVKVMRSLLSMDAYVVSLFNGGSTRVREAQQWLNATFLRRRDFAVVPCDGVFSRDVQKALVLAIQYELGMADGTANGSFGPGTQSGLRSLALVASGSSDGATRFVRLFQAALLFNGYDVALDGAFGPGTREEVLRFQDFTQLPSTGQGDYATWCSLLVSTGDPDRRGTGADTNVQLTRGKAAAIRAAGYRTVGRYLSGPTKHIAATELAIITDAGLTLVPIYQVFNNAAEYFDEDIGFEHGWSAVLRARQLGIRSGAIIYFPVDFDAMGGDITSLVLPFFRGVRAGVSRARDGEFRIGVYGPRHVCQRVLDAGLAVSAWASGIPRGWSGNLGYPLPDAWAYDQIQTLTVGTAGDAVTIDKNIVSPKAEPVGRDGLLPTPSRRVTGGTGTTDAFDDFFWRVTQLAYEAEVVLEHSVVAPLVRPHRNNLVIHYLQRDKYWDLIWQAYTPLPEHAVAGGALGLALGPLREQFHETASAAPALDSYAGDIPHWAASTAGYMAWSTAGGPPDTVAIGDHGAWSLDLATFWANEYVPVRRASSDVNVTDYCAARLCNDAPSDFGYRDLVADVDAYLVARRMSDGRDVGDALREVLVESQADPRWRFRTFVAERFAGSRSAIEDAVRHLFRAANPAVSLPTAMLMENERRPGISAGAPDPTGAELAAELDDLARAFADRLLALAG